MKLFKALARPQAAKPQATVVKPAEPVLSAADTEQVLRALQQQTKTLTAALTGIRKQLEHQPYVVAELMRRYNHLIDGDMPMPVLGANWAAIAPTILFIVDEVMGRSARRTMLECGSGASTLWTAAALRKCGEGHVTSVEHDREFAEVTRQRLVDHGLESWATVVDAPLVDTEVPGLGTQPWYDLSGLGDIADVDLLFIDGPPRPTAPLARYPAVPQLLPRLAKGALVVLDDTNRKVERDITKMWASDGAFDRRVTFVKDVARSTVLQLD
ncbi:class I SAM-dependent methyltransferase [Streptomyces sp. NBC_01016]|uniref:class I SAM-dependent methyltransferase n=1 Tax=Streptomyces sp. NBC_01016 TaxID=2903720 RepID=UPI00225946EC|nr:class I SAM-dependent methyltransferase [Streptomyces sp. NBC_01016]MCX4830215.1 class I SAM-dependent methyltransferase [Streptomyces sp. NBC_01016]